MPPGAPDGVIKPSVISHSPFSILASWKDPARNNAKGNPLFQLQYRAVFPQENERNAFDYATRQMSFELKGNSNVRLKSDRGKPADWLTNSGILT